MPAAPLSNTLTVTPWIVSYTRDGSHFGYNKPIATKPNTLIVGVKVSAEMLTGFDYRGNPIPGLEWQNMPDHIKPMVLSDSAKLKSSDYAVVMDAKGAINSGASRPGNVTILSYQIEGSAEDRAALLSALKKSALKLESGGEWGAIVDFTDRKQPLSTEGALNLNHGSRHYGFANESQLEACRGFLAEYHNEDRWRMRQTANDPADSAKLAPQQIVSMLHELATGKDANGKAVKFTPLSEAAAKPGWSKSLTAEYMPLENARVSSSTNANGKVEKINVRGISDEHMQGFQQSLDIDRNKFDVEMKRNEISITPKKGFMGFGGAKADDIKELGTHLQSQVSEWKKSTTVKVTLPPDVHTTAAPQIKKAPAITKPITQSAAETKQSAPSEPKLVSKIPPPPPPPQIKKPNPAVDISQTPKIPAPPPPPVKKPFRPGGAHGRDGNGYDPHTGEMIGEGRSADGRNLDEIRAARNSSPAPKADISHPSTEASIHEASTPSVTEPHVTGLRVPNAGAVGATNHAVDAVYSAHNYLNSQNTGDKVISGGSFLVNLSNTVLHAAAATGVVALEKAQTWGGRLNWVGQILNIGATTKQVIEAEGTETKVKIATKSVTQITAGAVTTYVAGGTIAAASTEAGGATVTLLAGAGEGVAALGGVVVTAAIPLAIGAAVSAEAYGAYKIGEGIYDIAKMENEVARSHDPNLTSFSHLQLAAIKKYGDDWRTTDLTPEASRTELRAFIEEREASAKGEMRQFRENGLFVSYNPTPNKSRYDNAYFNQMDYAAARTELNEYEQRLAQGKAPMLGLYEANKVEMLNLSTYFSQKNGKTVPPEEISKFEDNAERLMQLLDQSKAGVSQADRKKVDDGITQLLATLPAQKRQALITDLHLNTTHYKYALADAKSYYNPKQNSVVDDYTKYRTHGGMDFTDREKFSRKKGEVMPNMIMGFHPGLGDRLDPYLQDNHHESHLAANERVLIEVGFGNARGEYHAAIGVVDAKDPNKITITQVLNEKTNTFEKIKPKTVLLDSPEMAQMNSLLKELLREEPPPIAAEKSTPEKKISDLHPAHQERILAQAKHAVGAHELLPMSDLNVTAASVPHKPGNKSIV